MGFLSTIILHIAAACGWLFTGTPHVAAACGILPTIILHIAATCGLLLIGTPHIAATCGLPTNNNSHIAAAGGGMPLYHCTIFTMNTWMGGEIGTAIIIIMIYYKKTAHHFVRIEIMAIFARHNSPQMYSNGSNSYAQSTQTKAAKVLP